jgi:DNA-binding response OmpR family regulator
MRKEEVKLAKLLIVEDDRDTNDGICEYLAGAGHELYPAYDGEQAIVLFDSRPVDLIILDIMLPKIDGLTVLKKVRENSNVPVLMMTAIEDENTQIASFDGLADDYITKPFSIVLLGKRVSALLRRAGKGEDIRVWRHGDITVDFSSYTADNAGASIDFAPKEYRILKLLIDNKGLVLTRGQILDEIWGLDSPDSDRTIDTYIRRIRQKLNLNCIETIKGVGYKFEAEK